jgi:P27 family predicted phage terminase small subunit
MGAKFDGFLVAGNVLQLLVNDWISGPQQAVERCIDYLTPIAHFVVHVEDMGRPRTPIKSRLLAGNPHRRPIPTEPQVPPLEGSALLEECMSPDAQRWYAKLAPKIREYISPSEVDESALRMMACAWGMAVLAERKVSREGLTRDGHRNPAAAIWRDNAALFLQFASRFGLTPSDRARLGIVEPKPPRRHSTLDGEWFPEDEMEEIKKEEMMRPSTLPRPDSATKPA